MGLKVAYALASAAAIVLQRQALWDGPRKAARKWEPT